MGIDARREIPVHRPEVFEEIQRSNREAAGIADPLPDLEAPAVAATPAILNAQKSTHRRRLKSLS